MNKHFFLFAIVLMGSIGVSGTLTAQSVVHLEEVQVVGIKKESYLDHLYTIHIDSVLKTKYLGSDLSQVLKNETNLNITSYGGQGSLTSIRLRGSAPSQTQINWNGIPVNSPTTGSIDLSLLSGGMADAIDIAYGAGGSLFGNGTFGGSINLSNKPDWDNRLTINLTGEAGSWNHYKTGASVQFGNQSFQYHGAGLYQSSPNAFRYHNTFKAGNPIEYRLNDSLNVYSFQQHLFFKLPHHWYLQYGAWYHNREKQTPASMSTTPVFTALQNDRSLRQFVRASRLYKKSSFEWVAAYFTDSLSYSEIDNGNDSVLKHSGIRTSNTYLSGFHKWSLSENLTWENGIDYEYQTAKVESYSGIAHESRLAAFTQIKYRYGKIETNGSYRQVFYSMTGPKSLFATSVQYHLPITGLIAKAQVSNKFRFPTLNDRYWTPGGNPNLLPEHGYGYDLGLSWNSLSDSRLSINLGSLLFIQHINDWIQWVPVGTYWAPRNVRQVKCQGLELNLNGNYTLNALHLSAKTMYTYTESLDMSLTDVMARSERQLAYVPLHLLKVQTGIGYHRLEASLSYKYTSQRFTTDDHDPWLNLEPTHLFDASLGYTFKLKRGCIVLTGNVYNLFDVSYQLIRAYPAPGRSFYLSVNYLFNKKTTRNDE